MKSSINRLDREKKTIETMIQMYCKKNHIPDTTLCHECTDLLTYTKLRLDACQFGEDKPTCEKCTIHCYIPEMREKIRLVMRYSGPRMIYTHPIMGFRHLFKKIKNKE